jgi:glycogen synthase
MLVDAIMPPRVLFVSRALHPVSGGGERAVAAAALARALAAHGARVLAVTPAIDDRPARHGLARRLEPLRIDGPDGPGALELHEGRLADGRVEVIVPTTADLDQLGRVAVAAAAARAFAPTAVHIEEGAEDAAAALAAAGAPIVTAAAIDRPPGIDEVRWPRRPLAGDRDRAAARRRLLDRLDLEPRPRRPLIAALGPFERELLDDAGTAALAARALTLFAVDPARDGGALPWLQPLVDGHERAMAIVRAGDAAVAELLAAADFALLPHPLPAGPSDLHCLRFGAPAIAPADHGYGRLLVECDGRTGTGSGLLYRAGDHDLAHAVARAADLHAARALPRLAAAAAAVDLSWRAAARRALDAYDRAARNLPV